MSKELMLTGNRYVRRRGWTRPRGISYTRTATLTLLRGQSVISLTFFVTYIIFQPASTVVIRKLGPRAHLSIITLLWGACMIGMGFVKNWTDLAALRVVLGVLEAGFFPSMI